MHYRSAILCHSFILYCLVVVLGVFFKVILVLIYNRVCVPLIVLCLFSYSLSLV
ncbi:hypothetical protein BDF14DRAFT_1807510 [Spinellus fusiger]|nr:hypothetical protein BDF14DRAFT_1807510 [Spinellus fusiger]